MSDMGIDKNCSINMRVHRYIASVGIEDLSSTTWMLPSSGWLYLSVIGISRKAWLYTCEEYS